MIENFYLHSRGSGPKLRIGVLLDDSKLIAPFASVLRHIRQCDFAQLELVIRGPARPNGLSSSRLERSWQALTDKRKRSAIAYSLYHKWDGVRNSKDAETYAVEDCAALLRDVPEILITPLGTKTVQQFPAETIEEIRKARLDVIVRFGFNILKGDILNCARHGVWSYHHGDSDQFRGGPPAFWEIVERQPLTGALLQVLNEELDAGAVLAKTLTPTKLGMSRAANLVAPYLTAEPLVIEKLHQLHERGWASLQGDALPRQPYSGRRKPQSTPTNADMAKWLLRQGVPAIARRVVPRDKRTRSWTVGVRPAMASPPWKHSWSNFRWLDAPHGHYYADPVLFEHEGRTWLFVEDYDNNSRKGTIACAELKSTSEVGPWRVVLDRPYHLSYPCVFVHDGEVLMIPEARQSGHIELFRAIDFPDKWTLDCVLLDKPGLDTNLHVADDGTHYFFTSIRHKDGAHAQLFLFTSSGLREPWSLHPASPLSRDARYSRNAGPIFRHDGMLVRPSQDATLWYGQNSHFHEIAELTPSTYRETLVGSGGTELGVSAVGTHAYSRSTRWEAIDCLRLVDTKSTRIPQGGQVKD